MFDVQGSGFYSAACTHQMGSRLPCHPSPVQYMFVTMNQALCWALGDNRDHYRDCFHPHGTHGLTGRTEK